MQQSQCVFRRSAEKIPEATEEERGIKTDKTMAISGCIILGVSIYLKVSKDGNITSESLPGIDLMIAIGVIILVLGFLGCCGAIRENRCLLLLFFISLLIIFVLLLLAAGILGALKCCGVVNGPSDWTKIPESCRCNATETDCKSNAIYQEIFGMAFSMILYCQISRKDAATTTA
ncbi:hypothetical protein F7725_022099 [Dissostichus mawsoni]|uniref:Tetraspanin n=1 Tax=Dissostichus mawsoni TaxID=36200 RepID=A0A7J5ZDP1_DISMA|nr:hypothetical protein F7725_022099 [Dissostichus mawsoni]